MMGSIRRRQRRFGRVGIRAGMMLALAVMAAALGAQGAMAAPARLNVAYSTISPSALSAWIAQDLGLFKKHGLDVNLVYISSGTTTQQAQAAGEVDLSMNSAGPVLTAAAGGLRFRIVATFLDRLADELVVAPSVQKAEQLKGQRVGISRFGSATDVLMRTALSRLGLNPDKDVTIVQIGDEAVRFAALVGGNVAATVIEAPQTELAHERGFPTLVRLNDLGIRYLKLGLVVRPEMLTSRRQETVAFLKAVLEATSYLKSHRKETIDILAHWMKVDDRKAVEQLYDTYRNLYPEKPFVNADSLKLALEIEQKRNPSLAGFDINAIIDNSLVEELDKSGFIDGLYK